MKDDADKQLDDLFALVRSEKPDTTRLEFGFETRLLARLRAAREPLPWFAPVWRYCPVFALIVIALGIWTFCSPPDFEMQSLANSAGDNSQVLEYFAGEQI